MTNQPSTTRPRVAVTHLEDVGVVVIGRNEGQRLISCLESVVGRAILVVYVDSGSTDGSVTEAQRLGVETVELDLSVPFTAARARNAGFDHLIKSVPELRYVQFVDGDCEVVDGWLTDAREMLEARDELAVVCGRRRERHPEASLYNRLADMEWDTPIGDAKACGGDAMMRVEPFCQVGGFDPTLIAGEEPELCHRFRSAGWKIARIDAEMTRHDAAMTRFSQWWRRNVRAGHARAEAAQRYGRGPNRYVTRRAISNYVWGFGVPLAVVGLAWPTSGWSFLGLFGYLLIIYRAAQSRLRNRILTGNAVLYGVDCALGKLPQAIGQLRCAAGRLLGRRATLIEYKGPTASGRAQVVDRSAQT